MTLQKTRCDWAFNEPIYLEYHDREWGVPLHDDRRLFELLILEGAQAGLSWLTVLKKRENYRRAFDSFHPEKIARYGSSDVRRLLEDSGIIRNRLKIESTIQNAKSFLAVKKERGSFDSYIWSFVKGKPIKNRWMRIGEILAKTAESDSLSKDLLSRGFRFVGSTICYSFMQATGMVNDHIVTCFRYNEV
jgi:DNA-3-methyladenine glycosylase I